jgi:hypothetical protein
MTSDIFQGSFFVASCPTSFPILGIASQELQAVDLHGI